MEISPLERGFKGCVTVRDAAWAEGLRDTVSRGLVLRGVIRQASGDHFDFQVAVLGRHTPPTPLERGGSGATFFLMMSGLWRGDSPLERGLRGVLRGEARCGQRGCGIQFREV